MRSGRLGPIVALTISISISISISIFAILLGGCLPSSSSDSNATHSSPFSNKGSSPAPQSLGSASNSKAQNSNFIKIRDLLSLEPEATERLVKLETLVAAVCHDTAARAEFLDGMQWSVSFSTEKDQTTAKLAAEAVEHVATSCARTEPTTALELLDRAQALATKIYHFDLVRSRLLASLGRLEEALKAARRAKEAGSIHAIALGANIEAEIARSETISYEAGMLDGAISTVSATPTADWSLIDLTAVLSTRARLLGERAVWEESPKRERSLAEGQKVLERLAVAPFIEAVRTRSLDVLCFHEATTPMQRDFCKRAAVESLNLGAAELALVPVDERFDRARHNDLLGARDVIANGTGSVLIVARGDEAELLEWMFPAAHLLARMKTREKTRFIVVDRGKDERAGALVHRMLTLAGVEPSLALVGRSDPLLMPCVAAVMSGRRTPNACPLDKPRLTQLSKLAPVQTAILIGRDLDAEIDDLRLYGVDVWLLSFRLHRVEKAKLRAFKSLSDVFIAAPVSAVAPASGALK